MRRWLWQVAESEYKTWNDNGMFKHLQPKL